MIEARVVSVLKCCQKIFRMKEAVFYRDLMESEAGHYTTFITYARNMGDVEKRWREWIDFEASIIENYGKKETIHG
jgi:tRNA-(ms[2]io[6]A)-hydroxylase